MDKKNKKTICNIFHKLLKRQIVIGTISFSYGLTTNTTFTIDHLSSHIKIIFVKTFVSNYNQFSKIKFHTQLHNLQN